MLARVSVPSSASPYSQADAAESDEGDEIEAAMGEEEINHNIAAIPVPPCILGAFVMFVMSGS